MGRDSGDVASEKVGPTEALLAELATLLAASASGLAFVYDGLELLATRWKLADAVVVVDTPSTGPQAFRLGRRPLEGSWATGLVKAGPPRGLHTEPVILEPDVAEGFAAMAEIGLRLDVLDHDAAHDSLTGLLNRRSFDAMLDQALARSKRHGWAFSLVMFDLNRFKSLNDRLGHAAGDEVLREVGSVLRSSLRAGDVAARIGGDEFAVLLTHGDRPTGQVLATRVHDLVNANLDWADVGFAVGSATAPTEANEAHDLYQLADRRLYEAKAG